MGFVRVHGKALGGCAAACLLVGGSLLWLHKLSEPATAQVFTTLGSTTATPADQTTPLITIRNPYASFSYPNTLTPLAGMDGPSGNEVAVYNYGKPDIVPWHLAITINRLQEPLLTYDSGYLVRKNHPAQYQAATITSGINTFTVMTDTQAGGFSKAAFVLHGSLSANISLTGDDSSGGNTLEKVFLQTLQSWQWR